MVKRERDLNDMGIEDYESARRTYPGYTTGEETGVTPSVFVDKSQHMTINIYTKKDEGTEVDTAHRITPTIYILEREISQRLLEMLDQLETVLDDPPSFEMKLSKFSTIFQELYKREVRRERYFSDVLSMLKMGLSNIECSALSRAGISALREAVSSLAYKISQDKLCILRKKFRDSGIDVLRPFKLGIDDKDILAEMYPDETAT